jgi:hypothetical protein
VASGCAIVAVVTRHALGISSAFAGNARAADEHGFAYKVEPAVFGGVLAPPFLVRIEL